ncbi:hypothetical protein [Azoarcus taiwanensis]|uniref:hypothetical protein n=1 Tax=Azoarcus taiwanensis TaxID=666964 RepID=UPI001B7D1ED5|nr:hypothetical protein [Azoarcus taiwanensis]
MIVLKGMVFPEAFGSGRETAEIHSLDRVTDTVKGCFELDKTYRSESADGLLLIHDGRARLSQNSPLERNGSWLEISFADEGCVVLTSDRLGTVPVFWGLRDGRAFFASRLVDMVRFGFDKPDPIGVHQFVLQNHSNWERTVLAGVSLMPPATRLRLAPGGAAILERYWAPTANDSNETESARWLDEGIETVRGANRRALETSQPGRIAWPITGGLDSRCNVASCIDLLKEDDLFFHVEDLGDYELPIARQIAATLDRNLVEFDASDWMSDVSSFDLNLDSGDFNVGHWRLAGASRVLAQEHGCGATVDGFLQGILMNPAMFLHPVGMQEACDKRFALAQHRARRLELDNESSVFKAFTEDFMQRYACGRHGLDASQQYIMENRSRRMVFGIVRLNANHLDVRTPGLDNEFIDYATRLPWGLRKDARIYKQIINAINPALGAIKHDKTGLPVSAGPGLARSRKLAKLFRYYRNRLLPSSLRRPEKETAFERLLRTNGGFRNSVFRIIGHSEWIREVFGSGMVDLFERQHTGRGMQDDCIGAMLTIALLEKSGRT